MRVNIYSQELPLDMDGSHDEIELGLQQANTGIGYSFVRLFLHSSERLHHPPHDDDRSAITFWLPKSWEKRQALATMFEDMAGLVRAAPPETGLD
jgi:hypothetical protein